MLRVTPIARIVVKFHLYQECGLPTATNRAIESQRWLRYQADTPKGESMKICPTCQSEVAVFIVNVQTGREHCHGCIGPTFKPHLVYSEDDVRALRSMGVATETEAIEDLIQRARQDVYEDG